MNLKLKNTKLQNLIELAALLLLIGMYVILIVRWGELPDKIPGHYNALGEIDRWGNKSELIVVPIMTTILYGILTLVSCFPAIWNMPVSVSEENKVKAYSCVKTLLILMKTEMIAIFFWVNYNSMEAKPMTPWFLPIFLVTIFGTIAYFIVRTIKLSK